MPTIGAQLPVEFIARLGVKATPTDFEAGRPYVDALAARLESPEVSTLAQAALANNVSRIEPSLTRAMAPYRNDGIAYRVTLELLQSPLSGSMVEALGHLGRNAVERVFQGGNGPTQHKQVAAVTGRFISELANCPGAVHLATAALEVTSSPEAAGHAYGETFHNLCQLGMRDDVRAQLANLAEHAIPYGGRFDTRFTDPEPRVGDTSMAQERATFARVYINRMVNDDGHCPSLPSTPLEGLAREARTILDASGGDPFVADTIGHKALFVLGDIKTPALTRDQFLGTLGTEVASSGHTRTVSASAAEKVLKALAESEEPEVATAAQLALQVPLASRYHAAEAAFETAREHRIEAVDQADGFASQFRPLDTEVRTLTFSE